MWEHCTHTITRFVSGLRFDIRRAMINKSYGVDSIKDAFGFVLKIDLTFKVTVGVKAWEQSFKWEGYGHYDYQCSSESRHVNIVPSDDVDDSKVVEDVHIHSEISSVTEDPLVNLATLIIDESCVFCMYRWCCGCVRWF